MFCLLLILLVCRKVPISRGIKRTPLASVFASASEEFCKEGIDYKTLRGGEVDMAENVERCNPIKQVSRANNIGFLLGKKRGIKASLNNIYAYFIFFVFE